MPDMTDPETVIALKDAKIKALQQLVEGIERIQLDEQVRLEEVVSSLRRTHPELVYTAEAEVYKAKQEAAQEKGNE
jgi:ABC-type nitrate/sulfonate/bicarbonate transport system substrate-binding protein